MNKLNTLELQLCDLQGRIFEYSVDKKYNSNKFIEKFMNSKTTSKFDEPFDRLQWLGELYYLDELDDECNLVKDNNQISKEIIYWIGYIYRYWHFYKKINSKEIYKIANFQTMYESYLSFHTMDPTMAIDNLIEIHNQKH